MESVAHEKREVKCDLETERSMEETGGRKCPMCKEKKNAVHTYLNYSEIQKWGVYG